ncbi:MAG: hypothetical protein J7549_07445 [Variovorax sp.]|nr:hypothetical protein [Variovorax sp.]
MKRTNWLLAAAAAAVLATGCADMGGPQAQSTVGGAAIGAAAGAGIAAIAGGDAWTGAAIGGVAGGVAGNIHGRQQQQRWW